MTRPRSKPIKAYATPDEHARITALAESANLSLSAYLIAAGLNQQIRSVSDVYAVFELSKFNGELGRIVALLKMLEADRLPAPVVKRMLKEFRELQKKSHEIMGRMLR